MSGKFGGLSIGTNDNAAVAPGFTDTSFSVADVYGGSFLIYKTEAGVNLVQSLNGEIMLTPTLTQGDASTIGLKLNVHKGGPRMGCASSSSALYDPTERIRAGGGSGDYNCDPVNPDECFRGDLSGKNTAEGLSLPSVARELMSEKSMDLYDVIGRSLTVQIRDGGESLIGCARIPGPVAATETMRIWLNVGCSLVMLLIFVVVQFVAE